MAMKQQGRATWDGSRGVAVWTVDNLLDREVSCRLAISAPEGYRVNAKETLIVSPGKSATVQVEVAAPAVKEPPAAVTVTLTLRDFPDAGSLRRAATFR